MPSCASEITSLTPRRPRRVSLRKELRPDRLGLGCADLETKNLAPPIGVDADGDDDGDRDDPPASTDLEVGGVDPEMGPVTFEGAVQKRLHRECPIFCV